MSQISNAYQSEQSKLAERLRPLADEILRTLKEEYVMWLQEVEKIEVGEIEVGRNEVEKGEKDAEYKADVKWVLYKPRPRFMLTEMGQEDPSRHSVLTVTDKNGKSYIMDLTHPQFGFRLPLLLDKDIYVKEYTNINDSPEVADSKLQTKMERLSQEHYDGLYQKLQERLTEMAKASVGI